MSDLITRGFIEQPLALPGSADYNTLVVLIIYIFDHLLGFQNILVCDIFVLKVIYLQECLRKNAFLFKRILLLKVIASQKCLRNNAFLLKSMFLWFVIYFKCYGNVAIPE